jgi:hypothetical protein
LILVAALAVCSQPAAGANGAAPSQTRPINGAAFCQAMQPQVQAVIAPKLSLHSSSDSTDELHLGETPYVECDFRANSDGNADQITVGLHDATSGTFDFNPQGNHYAPLVGFGDRARYTVQGAMGMRWVDVVKGGAACEVRVALDDSDIKGDWKQVAGNLCNAAFAAM